MRNLMGSKRSMLCSTINTQKASHRGGLLACFVVIALSLGCGESDPADLLAAANDTNIKRLSNLYEAFQSRHNWRGPKSEEDFKDFLKSWNPKKLTNIGVDPNAIDDVFISGRDSEPFKVRYGVPGHIMGSDAAVVFEATGVDGQRMVGFLNMTTREVDDAEYKHLWSGAADPKVNTAR